MIVFTGYYKSLFIPNNFLFIFLLPLFVKISSHTLAFKKQFQITSDSSDADECEIWANLFPLKYFSMNRQECVSQIDFINIKQKYTMHAHK